MSSATSGANRTYTDGNSFYLENSVKYDDSGRSDCFVINNHVACCTSPEMARDLLQKAVERTRKLMNKKMQSHLLIKIQPLLVDKNGKKNQVGDLVAFLDMASYEGGRQRSGRLRDSLANRDDAHTSMLHCLRAIQHNEELMKSRKKQSRSGERLKSKEPREFKKIPFLQHKVAVLLQPLFSRQHTEMTHVSLLLTLSPSYRDFNEKKELLHDVESLHRPAILQPVVTGTKEAGTKEGLPKKVTCNKVDKKHRNGNLPERDCRSKNKDAYCSDNVNNEKPEQEFCDDNTESSSYLGPIDDYLEPLPPPLAPSYQPAAPCTEVMIDSSSNRLRMMSIDTADFPGICLASEKTKPNDSNSLHDTRSKEGDKEGGLPPPAASAPVEEADQHGDNSYYASVHFFNYLKTINNLVSASKKKGRQVMEKIAVSTNQGYNRDTTILELEGRLAKLEKRNNKLIRENHFLRDQNMRLIQENMGLKLSINGSVKHGYLSSTSDDDKSEEDKSDETESLISDVYHNDADTSTSLAIHAKKTKSPAKENHSQWHSLTRAEENAVPCDGEQEPYSPKNSLDDLVFKHMATINDDSTKLWHRQNSSATRRPLAATQAQVRNNCNQVNSKSSTTNIVPNNDNSSNLWDRTKSGTTKKPSAVTQAAVMHYSDQGNSKGPERSISEYHDPVFAHMADMNRDWYE